MADRFSIDKKKVGFFRFGLMNEARLENASIRIYASANPPAKNANASHHKASSGQPLTFNNVFSKGALPSFPIKRVSSILMEPVYVEIRDEQSAVTQISASSAAIRLRKRDIFFKGKVKVVSGSRILTTDRLTVIPDNAAIKTDRHFVLNTPEKKLEGNQLITDICLKSISP